MRSLALSLPRAPLDDQGTPGRGPRLETLEPWREFWVRPGGDWPLGGVALCFFGLPVGEVAAGFLVLPFGGALLGCPDLAL